MAGKGDMGEPAAAIRDHWNAAYRSPVYPDDPTPVLPAALAHFGDVRGRRLLDIGCGLGVASRYFASRGAKVTAIDISDVAVEQLRELCAITGESNVDAKVCSAMTADRLGPFDLVFGSMILHHIEPFQDFSEVLARATVPGGKAFFYENSARSRLLIWFRTNLVGRFGIPKYGDEHEFPLQPSEVDMLRPFFDVQIDIPELRFFRLMSTYFFRRRLGSITRALDRWFYKRGFLNQYSYRQYVKLVRRQG
jgi:SAM-dependent methyltransferase